MAGKNNKQKSTTRRQATPHEKAVLRAAKARGLTGIDLRKPLSKYARSLVKKFEPVYSQEASVVTVPRGSAKKIKGVTFAKGKAIIPKRAISETARYDKRTGRIVVTDSVRGTRRFAGRSWKAKTRTVIVFRPGTSKRRIRTYSGSGGAAAAAQYLAQYDDDVLEDADIHNEYFDDDLNAWLRDQDETAIADWLRGYDGDDDDGDF